MEDHCVLSEEKCGLGSGGSVLSEEKCGLGSGGSVLSEEKCGLIPKKYTAAGRGNIS